MPGASATGYFAHNPITSVPNTAATAVAVKTAWVGMPSSPRTPWSPSTDGFTARTYDMARNVTVPAISSRLTVEPFELTPKYLSI